MRHVGVGGAKAAAWTSRDAPDGGGTMSTPPRIPDWQLERHRLSELPPDQTALVDETLRGDPGLGARLDELRVDDEKVLAEHPPRVLVARIRERIAAATRGPAPS